jgi:GntR family transcriptional regulator/MocR family aminotransferase
MARRTQSVASLAISLDRGSSHPLHRQIYQQLREIILAGRVGAGALLPSTRTLTRELGVSRTTLQLAFDQLRADGYIQGRIGSGTYAAGLPFNSPHDHRPSGSRQQTDRMPRTSHVVQQLGHGVIPRDRYLRAFRPGLPETDLFPFPVWRRLISRFWKKPPSGLLYSSPPAGYEPLRVAIAEYLRIARGVICTPDQVIVTSGTQNAIQLIARALINRGDRVWVEEPGYPNARYALLDAGAKLIPVPVDSSGLHVAFGKRKSKNAQLAMVTPSRQYPLGVSMGLSRRLELLEWSNDAGAWIVEDDYDAEYRYGGPPISALYGLDKSERVIYVGTFSKLMFRTLRLGYVVVPDSLVDAFLRVRMALDGQLSIVMQPALAEFIESGQFAKHIRRMRPLYAERQEVLIGAVNRHLGDHLEVKPNASGMHVVANLTSARWTDVQLSNLAFEAGVSAPALSSYFLAQSRQQGLLLGFAGLKREEIHRGVRTLSQQFSRFMSARP